LAGGTSSKSDYLRCEGITIENAVCLQLLPYLDGSRNHTALLDLLNEWCSQENS